MRPPTKLLIAARQMLDLSQADLAAQMGIGARTVYELERMNGSIETVEALVAHYESRGITFKVLGGNGGWAICNSNILETYDDERNRAWPDWGRRGKKQIGSEIKPAASEPET